MILSFPHLAVILTTLGTPKNIFCFNNNIMNDNSKQDHPGKNKFVCTLFAELCSPGNYHESSGHFEYPNKSILKSSHPKKYLPNFSTQKNPEIENFKPKKILRSSPPLEVRSNPPGFDVTNCSLDIRVK